MSTVISFPDDKIIHFPEGLLAFEKEKRFALLPFTEEGECPFEWLQCTQRPELAFVVTDPNIFIPKYTVDLIETERADIELSPDQSFALRVIVTVPDLYINMTANLVGPLAINSDNMIGKQFVLTTSQYDTRYHLFPGDIRESKTPVS